MTQMNFMKILQKDFEKPSDYFSPLGVKVNFSF